MLIDDDDDFEKALRDSENEALVKAINSLSTSLSQNNNKEIVDAIKLQSGKIEGLFKNIPEPPKQENPQIFINLTQKMCADIISSNNKVITAIENRLLPDTFELKKNSFGITESVKVNYKSAKDIKIK